MFTSPLHSCFNLSLYFIYSGPIASLAVGGSYDLKRITLTPLVLLVQFKMARGPRKHMKRIGCPKHWMLDKLTGVFAPRPSAGPHKLRECVPMIILIRNRLKYALTYAEAKVIMNSRAIKVDDRIRTDITYPCGFQDVISIEKTGENFRLLHDTKGRFVLHRITQQEASFKLCRVKTLAIGAGKVPYVVTHDGRTIRYPDPLIKPKDTVKVDLVTNKIIGFSKFEVGNVCVITGGQNIGRVGVIQVLSHSHYLFSYTIYSEGRGTGFHVRNIS